ncbi:argininosuccinate lyase, partial [Candidatus Bipolaricaulota bacterium]|nr:argininosuccinate lyase [Candidatus Bipolaricaulota bacterium]
MKIWELEDDSGDEEVTALVEKFTAGDDVTYDEKLKDYDLLGSIAHVIGLEKIEVLTSDESSKLQSELAKLLEEEIKLTAGDEDVHTKVENLLTEKLGDLGKKLHTGRSRNDQVLVDLRLFEKGELFEVTSNALELAKSLTDFAVDHVHTPMVGPSDRKST